MDITEQCRASAGAGYQVVYADPAWKFRANRSASNFEELAKNKGLNVDGRGVPYPTMTLKEIEAMPVKGMIADQAVCFMWITGPFLTIGAHIPIMKAWGFKPKAIGFTWVKLLKSKSLDDPGFFGFKESDFHVGLGLTTRKNAEFCLIGTRGKSLRQHKGIHEIGIFPRMEHSRKPQEFRRRIEQYVGPGLKMAELFCREAPEGWDPFGNEVGKYR